jgi:hypothetical protein
MEYSVSIIDIVTLLIALATAAVVIVCTFICYVRIKSYSIEKDHVIDALQAVNNALVTLAKKTQECEDAYVNTLRTLYRIDKVVGAMAGDVMGVSPDGKMGRFGTDGNEDLLDDDYDDDDE